MYNLFYEYHFIAATKGLWKESLAYSLELKTQSFHPIQNVLNNASLLSKSRNYYSGDLNARLVWYKNGRKESDLQISCYSKGDLNSRLF